LKGLGGELCNYTSAVASSRGEWSAGFGELSKICAERALKKKLQALFNQKEEEREKEIGVSFGNPCKSHHQKIAIQLSQSLS